MYLQQKMSMYVKDLFKRILSEFTNPRESSIEVVPSNCTLKSIYKLIVVEDFVPLFGIRPRYIMTLVGLPKALCNNFVIIFSYFLQQIFFLHKVYSS